MEVRKTVAVKLVRARVEAALESEGAAAPHARLALAAQYIKVGTGGTAEKGPPSGC